MIRVIFWTPKKIQVLENAPSGDLRSMSYSIPHLRRLHVSLLGISYLIFRCLQVLFKNLLLSVGSKVFYYNFLQRPTM